MKYKFIGTEDDLIDNGFVKVIDDKIAFIKRTNVGNIFIDKENNIFTFLKEEIKKMMKKGLVN